MKRLDLDFSVGSTEVLRFKLRNPETNLALDLSTLVNAWFTVRNPSNVAVLTYLLNGGITVVDATGATTNGDDSILAVTPASADSLALVAGTFCQYELWLKFADNERLPVYGGFFAVRASQVSDFTGEVPEDNTPIVGKSLVQFLSLVTGLTGGGPTKLDGILDGVPLAAVAIPLVYDLSIGDNDERWKLRAKAMGEVADGVALVSPTNAAFAAYIWVRIR